MITCRLKFRTFYFNYFRSLILETFYLTSDKFGTDISDAKMSDTLPKHLCQQNKNQRETTSTKIAELQNHCTVKVLQIQLKQLRITSSVLTKRKQKPTQSRMAFLKVYFISAGQTSLLQVQWKFYEDLSSLHNARQKKTNSFGTTSKFHTLL